MAIDRFKILSSEQLAKLMTASRQAINKRLKLLFHHHYLGKLPAQLSPKLFNSPDVFFLQLNRRARKHLEKRGVPLPYRNRVDNRLPKREHVRHALLTNDIEIAFETAARDNADFEFLTSAQLLAGTKRQNLAHPWKVPAFLPEPGITRNAFPDTTFALRYKSSDKTQLYLVEADCQTQPQSRRPEQLFRASNIKAKLILYHMAWKQGVFRERFEIPATQILFVTLSAARATNMRALAKEVVLDSAKGLFLFTSLDDLDNNTSFWAKILHD